MLPEWMKKEEEYNPPKGNSRFATQSARSIGKAMSKIRIQQGHEKEKTMPPLLKLLLMFAMILLLSITQNRLIVMAVAAVLLVYLCTWPAKDIWPILRNGLGGCLLACLILVPAIICNGSFLANGLLILAKVFLCILAVSIFNHTTQWNHVTGALKQLHVPAVFIFVLDITLKYIVVLGNLIYQLLTALQLRAVGRSDRKYTSVGGVMGITFLRGVEMNRQMYDAMRCRGFTDDYKGLKT